MKSHILVQMFFKRANVWIESDALLPVDCIASAVPVDSAIVRNDVTAPDGAQAEICIKRGDDEQYFYVRESVLDLYRDINGVR